METLEEITELRQLVKNWRSQNIKVAFVPTMGNLHEGHISLVNKAKTLADKVIVSIYVNPMQFGPNEDFDAYPRTLENDASALTSANVDALFLPTTQIIYPRSPANTTSVEVPGLSEILCGEHRPGHFTGVTTVVCKLLNLVSPHVLLLGEKDFQQVAVIRRMIEDLNMPVEVVTGETIRESDGLAKSSRNQYLSKEDRQIATLLYKELEKSVSKAKAGHDLALTESEAIEFLEKQGFSCDYFQFRDALNLDKPTQKSRQLVLLAAAYLKTTRLIDNLSLTLH